jgi:hypothetical protein
LDLCRELVRDAVRLDVPNALVCQMLAGLSVVEPRDGGHKPCVPGLHLVTACVLERMYRSPGEWCCVWMLEADAVVVATAAVCRRSRGGEVGRGLKYYPPAGLHAACGHRGAHEHSCVPSRPCPFGLAQATPRPAVPVAGSGPSTLPGLGKGWMPAEPVRGPGHRPASE